MPRGASCRRHEMPGMLCRAAWVAGTTLLCGERLSTPACANGHGTDGTNCSKGFLLVVDAGEPVGGLDPSGGHGMHSVVMLGSGVWMAGGGQVGCTQSDSCPAGAGWLTTPLEIAEGKLLQGRPSKAPGACVKPTAAGGRRGWGGSQELGEEDADCVPNGAQGVGGCGFCCVEAAALLFCDTFRNLRPNASRAAAAMGVSVIVEEWCHWCDQAKSHRKNKLGQ